MAPSSEVAFSFAVQRRFQGEPLGLGLDVTPVGRLQVANVKDGLVKERNKVLELAYGEDPCAPEQPLRLGDVITCVNELEEGQACPNDMLQQIQCSLHLRFRVARATPDRIDCPEGPVASLAVPHSEGVAPSNAVTFSFRVQRQAQGEALGLIVDVTSVGQLRVAELKDGPVKEKNKALELACKDNPYAPEQPLRPGDSITCVNEFQAGSASPNEMLEQIKNCLDLCFRVERASQDPFPTIADCAGPGTAGGAAAALAEERHHVQCDDGAGKVPAAEVPRSSCPQPSDESPPRLAGDAAATLVRGTRLMGRWGGQWYPATFRQRVTQEHWDAAQRAGASVLRQELAAGAAADLIEVMWEEEYSVSALGPDDWLLR